MTSVGEQFNQLLYAALKVEQQQENQYQPEQKEQMMIDESAKSQDFFQENKNISRKCTTTRIKSRNVLSNITYVGISKEDCHNENFVFDVYLLLTKNLNPFSLDRKLVDKNKHEIIYVLWKECIPSSFYKHICKEQYFLYLNGKNVLQPKVVDIITDFIRKDENNYKNN